MLPKIVVGKLLRDCDGAHITDQDGLLILVDDTIADKRNQITRIQVRQARLAAFDGYPSATMLKAWT